MFKKREPTRLGEILVGKGLITAEQLALATREQSKRNRQLSAADLKAHKGALIGAILIDLGFIDQLVLKRGLNWQQRLRHVSIAMALCAPFMALGSGGATAATSTTSYASSSTQGFGPVTIQAENYAAMSGVWNEPTTDVGGGQDTGNINTGDWMSYTNTKLDIPETGSYKVTFRVASLKGGGSLALKEASTDATLDTTSIPSTGSWQSWIDVVRIVTLTKGSHSFKLFAVAGGFNVNWFKIESLASQLPLTIQTENYSAMSGVWNEPTTDIGGGQDTGNINTLDWMEYYNVNVLIPTTSSYKISYRVASLNGGASFTLGEAGTSIVYDTIAVPKTGGWQNWISLERTISLPAGKHNFAIKALIGGFNINWFKIEPVAPTSAQSSSAVSTLSSSGVSSSKASSAAPSSVVAVGSSTPTTSTSSTKSSAPLASTSSAKSSAAPTSTSSLKSSAPVASSSSKSSSPSVSSSSSSAGPGSTLVKGPVALQWTPPDRRENGDILDITELAGYEIRYRLTSTNNFTYVSITDAWTQQYNFAWLDGNYVFQIAAFDKNGIYSNFVNIYPR